MRVQLFDGDLDVRTPASAARRPEPAVDEPFVGFESGPEREAELARQLAVVAHRFERRQLQAAAVHLTTRPRMSGVMRAGART